MLPILGEVNAVGVVLEEEDGVKLKNLTFVMITSRKSYKSALAVARQTVSTITGCGKE